MPYRTLPKLVSGQYYLMRSDSSVFPIKMIDDLGQKIDFYAWNWHSLTVGRGIISKITFLECYCFRLHRAQVRMTWPDFYAGCENDQSDSDSSEMQPAN